MIFNTFILTANGKPKDVKFVDFQLACACSPMKDLPYFLCASTSPDVMENNFEEMIDTYYLTFLEVLQALNCDITHFSRKEFDQQLKKDASDQFFRCMMALKIFTYDVPKDLDLNDLKSALIMTNASNLFIERLWKVVSKFVEKGWL